MAYVHAGQYGPETVADGAGTPLDYAICTVYESDGVTLATLYTDQFRTAAQTNPVIGDANGNLIFYAEPDFYYLGINDDPPLPICVYAFPNDTISTIGLSGPRSLSGTGEVYPTGDLSQYGAFDVGQGFAWSILSAGTGSLTQRSQGGMIWDSDHSQYILFGGFEAGASALTNETWTSPDGLNWTLQTVTDAPTARYGFGMVFVPGLGSVIIGGSDNFGDPAGTLNEVQVFDFGTLTWTSETFSGGPGALNGAATWFDPIRNRIYIFGGMDNSNVVQGNTWSLSVDGSWTWTELSPAGVPPTATFAARGGYDSDVSLGFIFGGLAAGPVVLAQFCTFDGTTWTTFSGPSPASRTYADVFAINGYGVVVSGGQTLVPPYYLDDTWVFANGAWSEVNDSGSILPHFAGQYATRGPDAIRFSGAGPYNLNEVMAFDGNQPGVYMSDYGLSLRHVTPIAAINVGGVGYTGPLISLDIAGGVSGITTTNANMSFTPSTGAVVADFLTDPTFDFVTLGYGGSFSPPGSGFGGVGFVNATNCVLAGAFGAGVGSAVTILPDPSVFGTALISEMVSPTNSRFVTTQSSSISVTIDDGTGRVVAPFLTIGAQPFPLKTAAPSDRQVLTWSATDSAWEPATGAPAPGITYAYTVVDGVGICPFDPVAGTLGSVVAAGGSTVHSRVAANLPTNVGAQSETTTVGFFNITSGGTVWTSTGVSVATFTDACQGCFNSDGSYFYVLDFSVGSLSAIKVADGTTTVLATGLSGPIGICISDDDSVLWVQTKTDTTLHSYFLSTATTAIAGGAVASGAQYDLAWTPDGLVSNVAEGVGAIAWYGAITGGRNSVTLSAYADGGVAVSPDRKTAFVGSSTAGNISVVRLPDLQPMADLVTGSTQTYGICVV